jgi:Tol biopolymer transport system component
LTFDEADDYAPIWTQDGERIYFASEREGELGNIFWKAANGTGEKEQLISEPNRFISPACLSSDGKMLLIRETGNMGNDIGMISMGGDSAKKILFQEKYDESDLQISPDGRWMAYTSAEHGPNEIFVCSFPDVSKGKWKISTDGGNSPLWSPNGRELFYRNGDAVIAVAVETKPTFKYGRPALLFSGTFYSTNSLQIVSTMWDISPDGKRFLMIKPSEAPRKITIVLNWFEELKERVPLD